MAEVGVKVDFSKKYKMEKGTKVIRLESNESTTYPIRAYTEHGEDFGYTEDGFFHLKKIKSKCNLVLDEDQPQETKKRKVVNILIGGNDLEDVIYSLCDDGNIYCIGLRQGKFDSWEKLPDLPQD